MNDEDGDYVVSGEPRSSKAFGNLAHGMFDGTIVTKEGIYHVEPAFR